MEDQVSLNQDNSKEKTDIFAKKEVQFTLEGLPSEEHQEKLYEMLVNEDAITWQSILKDLVKSEQMNPWDIDLKVLCAKYIETIKNLERMNFNLSGKILLASAILLKMKADRFMHYDIHAMDDLINFMEDAEDEFEEMGFDDDLERELLRNEYIPKDKRNYIVPRTPQPRKRKVSIYDLVEALEKALEVKQRRPPKRDTYREVKVPEKKVDINELMETVHGTILKLLQANDTIMFDDIIPEDTKEAKILAFRPALHLTNQRIIDMQQEEHFGPITINLLSNDITSALEANIELGEGETSPMVEKLMKQGTGPEGQKRFK